MSCRNDRAYPLIVIAGRSANASTGFTPRSAPLHGSVVANWDSALRRNGNSCMKKVAD